MLYFVVSHRMNFTGFHVLIAKEAWQILETTYKGTKKVKDTKLQMLTTQEIELGWEDKRLQSSKKDP